MRIIIDFDYTIFDTACLRAKCIAALQPFGVTEEQYHAAEADLKANSLYTIEQHLDLLFLQNENQRASAQQAIERLFIDIQDCLYADTIPFLEKAQQQKAEIILLSFGNPQWQQRKIDACHITQYFGHIIVTDQPKQDALGSLKLDKEDDILIINDRGSEIDSLKKVLPSSCAIWIQRYGTPYFQEPSHDFTICLTDLSSLTL